MEQSSSSRASITQLLSVPSNSLVEANFQLVLPSWLSNNALALES